VCRGLKEEGVVETGNEVSRRVDRMGDCHDKATARDEHPRHLGDRRFHSVDILQTHERHGTVGHTVVEG
jgi:hypothetical protein